MRRDPADRPTETAAARMFASVLPLLSSAEPEQSGPAHPPTAASQALSSAGPGAPAPKSTSRPRSAGDRELAAAASPPAIAAPAVAATAAENQAPALARPSAGGSAKAGAP